MDKSPFWLRSYLSRKVGQGGDILTVGTQLEQAISGVMSAAAAMKTCALETQDQQAKKTYQDLADTLDSTLQTLKDRQTYIKQQEPQFK